MDRPVLMILLGANGVGKTSLVLRWVADRFEAELDPTIEDLYRRECVVDGEACRVDTLDTAGNEDPIIARAAWIHDQHVAVVVYSIAQRSSWNYLGQLRDRIEAVLQKRNGSRIPLVVVGNMSDLGPAREVSEVEGKDLATRLGAAAFLETSAKENSRVEDLFFTVVRLCRESDPDHVSIRALARELVLLLLLAQRYDGHSVWVRLPRDVVVLIGRRVLLDAADGSQRPQWARAMAAHKQGTAGKVVKGRRCSVQ